MTSELHRIAYDADADLGGLDAVTRILMTFDGTLSSVLSAVHCEAIVADIVAVERRPATAAEQRTIDYHGEVESRTVVLRGQLTLRPHLFARSFIAVGRVPPAVLEALSTGQPLGHLIRDSGTSTLRRVLAQELDQGDHELRSFLEVGATVPICVRRSILELAGRPSVHLEEIFALPQHP